MAQLQFDEDQIQDFDVIRDLDPKQFSAAVSGLSKLQPQPMKAADLVAEIGVALKVDVDCAECVTRSILWLNGLIRENDIDVDGLMDAVRAGLVDEAAWSKQELDQWKLIEPSFRQLLDLDAVRIVATVLDLSYEYANLYQSGRILTDIRPVFSKNADQVAGAVVSFTFCVRFNGVNGDSELNIAMDEENVRSLSRQCDRALKKANTAREFMKKQTGIPTVISGESGNA